MNYLTFSRIAPRIAATAAMLLVSRAASAADRDTIAAAFATGWNGTTTPLYTDARLRGWLDDGTLDRLRVFPSTASDINTASGQGIGTADALAHVNAYGLGAVAGAQAGFTHPPNSETIAESIAYLKDTLFALNVNPNDTDDLITKFSITVHIDGHAKVFGDARVQLGVVLRLTTVLDEQFTTADNLVLSGDREYWFGTEAPIDTPADGTLEMRLEGPTTLPLLDLPHPDLRLMTLEQLFYVRAQVGVGGGTGLAGANFGNTLRVANIQLFNESGAVIPGLQIVGADGDIYPYNVPEPGLGTACIGAAAILVNRRRRRA